ncbi:hypothetical protein HDU93_001004 [Gonapodya sp. JEL0774]|nr:hypothetical protein HDU93_001004 [Gonapodya sp. JEL0774]
MTHPLSRLSLDVIGNNRQSDFEQILFTGRTPDGGRELDLETFRRLCFAGVPDYPPSVRSKCWKVLLNYTPWQERADWADVVHRQRTLYYGFIRDLTSFVPPPATEAPHAEAGQDSDVEKAEIPSNPAFLPPFPTDPELGTLEQIYRDVRRTLPDMAFFQQEVPKSWGAYSPLFHGDEASKETYPTVFNPNALYARISHLYLSENPPVTPPPEPHTHVDSLLRILYLFARLNPGVGYVQGMNELLAPLYYVCAAGTGDGEEERGENMDEKLVENAESKKFHDHFMRSLDNLRTPGSSRGGSRAMSRKATPPHTPTASNPRPKRVGALEIIEAVMPAEVGSSPDSPNALHSNEPSLESSKPVTESDANTVRDPLTTDADSPPAPVNGNVSDDEAHIEPEPAAGVVVDSTSSTTATPKSGVVIPPRTVSRPQAKRRIVGAGGVSHSMGRAWLRLRERDPELWRDMSSKSLHPIFFLFRWLTVLMTQEYPLPEVLRIWDTLLADIALDVCGTGPPKVESGGVVEWEKHERRDVTWRWDWLVELSVSMIVSIRTPLLESAFPDCLKLLQNYPHELVSLDLVLSRAYANYDLAVGRGLAGPDRFRGPGEEWVEGQWDEEETEHEDVVGQWVKQAGEFWKKSVAGGFSFPAQVRVVDHKSDVEAAGKAGGNSETATEPVESKSSAPSSDAKPSAPPAASATVAQWSQQTSMAFQGLWRSVNTATKGVVNEIDSAVAEGRDKANGAHHEQTTIAAADTKGQTEPTSTDPVVPNGAAVEAPKGRNLLNSGMSLQDSFKRLWGVRTPAGGQATPSKVNVIEPSPVEQSTVGENAEQNETGTTPPESSAPPAVATSPTKTVAPALNTGTSSFASFFRPRSSTIDASIENSSNPFLAIATSPNRSSFSAPSAHKASILTTNTETTKPAVISVSASLQGVWKMLGGVATAPPKPKSTVLFDADSVHANTDANEAGAGSMDSTVRHAAAVPQASDYTDGEAWEGGDLDMEDLDAWLEKLGSGTNTPTIKGPKTPSRTPTAQGDGELEREAKHADGEVESEPEDVGNVAEEIEKLLSRG